MQLVDRLSKLMSCPPPDEAGGVVGSEYVAWSVHEVAPLLSAWTRCPATLRAELEDWVTGSINPPAAPAGLQPERGWITAHPIYAAFWAQPLSTDVQGYDPVLGRYAQGAVLVAAHICSVLPGGLDQRQSALSKACLSVRRVLGNQHTPSDFWRIPYPVDLEEFHDGLAEVLDQGLPDHELSVMRPLYLFLHDALERRAPRAHRTVQRSKPQGNRSWEPDDPTFPHVIFDQIIPQSRAAVREASAPVSETATPRLMIVKPAAGEEHLTDGQRYHRAYYRAMAIATAAQGVMHSAERLQLVDLAGLDAAARRFLLGHWPVDGGVTSLSVAATFLSLLSGRGAEELQGLRLLRSVAEATSFRGSIGLMLDSSILILPIQDLPDAFQPDSADRDLYRQTVSRISLRLPDLPVVDVVRTVLSQTGRVFPFRGVDLRPQIAAFLNQVNAASNARTTPTRIMHFLYRQTHILSGDWADAALLSGNRRMVDPRLYYYAPAASSLRRLYGAVWAGVGKGVAKSGSFKSHSGDERKVETYIGSQGCPTDAAVAEMVRTQVQLCRNARQGAPGKNRVRSAHNALTTYTLLLVAWHVGVRAVDEMVDLSQYDATTGFLGVSDKDGDTYADARIVWLAPIARQQIVAYQRCVRGLPDSYNPGEDYDGRLFYIDQDGMREAISLRSLKQYLYHYSLRLNSQRHYLRTRLRELGVSGQAVDAMLGHGGQGYEPYARHSAFSPAQLRDEVSSAIQKLSQEMTWKVIPARP